MKTLAAILSMFLASSSAVWAIEAGKVKGNDDTLMEQSIQSAKQSMDREMLDELYHEAEDDYHEGRYNDALGILNKISAMSPGYQDAAQLRRQITARASRHTAEVDTESLRDDMRQGDEAIRAGQKALAISYWKKALAINPSYAPAQRLIEKTNKVLAQKEYDQGYLYYHQNDMENALDSWANAIALDPSYRKKGLLVLMSKVELDTQRDRDNRLRSQGYDQFQHGDLDGALQSFKELLADSPRDDEARQMVAKIKIHLGEAALSSAQKALAARRYAEAQKQADAAIGYGYETALAQKIKSEAQHPPAVHVAHRAKTPEKPVAPAVQPSTPTAEAAAPPPPPAQPIDAEGAMLHYRKGLAAIRTKEYRVAIQELDTAWQLDPSNERIYLARERAHQEGAALYDTAPSGDSGNE